MIRVAARATRALPLTVAAAIVAVLGALTIDTLLTVPLLPMGLPASWLVALASANLLVVALRPALGPISLTLVRNPRMQMAQIGFALVLSVGAYCPVAVSDPFTPQTSAWLILLATAAVAAAVNPDIAWMPVTVVGVAIESLNNLTMDSWYRAIAIHESSVRTAALVVLFLGLTVIAKRARRASWYPT